MYAIDPPKSIKKKVAIHKILSINVDKKGPDFKVYQLTYMYNIALVYFSLTLKFGNRVLFLSVIIVCKQYANIIGKISHITYTCVNKFLIHSSCWENLFQNLQGTF